MSNNGLKEQFSQQHQRMNIYSDQLSTVRSLINAAVHFILSLLTQVSSLLINLLCGSLSNASS
jgi:hypothetical protein